MTGRDKFRVFLEQAPDAFFAHDLQGRITDVNHNACANLGYTSQELLDMSVLDIEQGFDLPSAMALWAEMELGKTRQFMGAHRRKDGTTFPVEIHATGVMQGGEKTIFALVRDISARVLVENRLERQSKLYQALSEVNQAIVRMEDEEDLLPLVCRMAVEFGGMKLAWIGRERGAGTITPVASHGAGQEALKSTAIPIGDNPAEGAHPAATAWRSQERAIVNALPREAAAPWSAMGAFPILRKGKSYAVLTVCHDEAGEFDETIIRLLDEMARDVSYALDVFDHAASRQHASETIQAQNDFLNAILEAEPECVNVVSPAGKLVHMNPAGLAMLEVGSLYEAQQVGLEKFIEPGHRNLFREFHRSICAGDSGTIEFPLVGKKGTQRWLETHATPLRNARGEVTALLGITRDITEKKQANELIWRQANFDLLTELPNRNMFYDLLGHEIKRAQRDEAIVAVLFIDLDRFKEVNDTLGHQTGDLLLMEAARRIISCVRKSDTVARLGGDEFTVILPQFRSTDHVENVAQIILDRLAEPFQFPEKGLVYISASIGITIYPMDADDIEPLISNADQAMYAAKSGGRNRYSFFTHSLQERAQSRSKLLNDLREATKKDQLVMHFQPVVDLTTGRINKAESLMRWQHPKLGMLSPAAFIPLAEETGLIVEIGDWAFRESLRWASRWAKRHPGFKVSVNMSPVQFHNKVSSLGSWLDYMRHLELSGKNIVIEITESLLLEANTTINLQLNDFRDAEIEVAIDDFGTGYSSLSYINRFPIDYLKIDQSFVHDLVPGSQHHALSKAIIVMGHELGLKVIAEGIETDDQRAMLQLAGCDFGQGFLFARPIPPGELESRVFG